MFKFIFIFLASTLFCSHLWAQQTRIKVTLHPIVSMEVGETIVRCESRQRDLFVRIPLESFIVPSGELLRLELLHMSAEENVDLIYNETKRTILSINNPHFIVYPKRGTDQHLFELRFHNLPHRACKDVIKAIRFTLEPR